MISRVATIIWFLIYGVNYFIPFSPAALFLAVDALIIAVALMLNK